MSREKIGILKGSFDPIHQGHLRIALSALDACQLDRLYVMPAGEKESGAFAASREDRWIMTVTACTQDPRLFPSRLELDAAGPVSPAETLAVLRKTHPKADFFFILGDSGMKELRRWIGIAEELPPCSFVLCSGSGFSGSGIYPEEKERLKELGACLITIHTEPLEVSSQEIRDPLVKGLPTPYLFSPVREFCLLNGLYGLIPREDRARSWIRKLFSELTPHRFAHSLSVAACACRLARIHGVNQRQAEQAGLLHDCAKCMPLKDMQRIAEAHSLTDDPAILSSGALLHSVVGAWIARTAYGMTDPEVLDAITYHNTGHAGMSRLAMVVCLADSIEPTRDSYPLLNQVRAQSRISLERALLMSLEGTAEFVRERKKYLHPRTQDTIDWLKTLPEVRGGRNNPM